MSHDLLIGGVRRPGRRGRYFPVVNPATHAPLGQVAEAVVGAEREQPGLPGFEHGLGLGVSIERMRQCGVHALVMAGLEPQQSRCKQFERRSDARIVGRLVVRTCHADFAESDRP